MIWGYPLDMEMSIWALFEHNVPQIRSFVLWFTIELAMAIHFHTYIDLFYLFFKWQKGGGVCFVFYLRNSSIWYELWKYLLKLTKHPKFEWDNPNMRFRTHQEWLELWSHGPRMEWFDLKSLRIVPCWTRESRHIFFWGLAKTHSFPCFFVSDLRRKRYQHLHEVSSTWASVIEVFSKRLSKSLLCRSTREDHHFYRTIPSGLAFVLCNLSSTNG